MTTEPHNQPVIPGVQNLTAPWRHSYMQALGDEQQAAKSAPPKTATNPPSSSFFRDYWLNPGGDEANHVIVRTSAGGEKVGGMVLLNRYPYSNGHLLIALSEPRPRLLDYSPAQRRELWELVDLAVDLCERALLPQGVNVGLNQGAAAGAGVPTHAHVHVVPRWLGDVNFMSVVGNVRVIPSALEDMAKRYREVWNRPERIA